MSENRNKRTNPTGKLFDSYPAAIVSVEHPKGLYLAKIRLLGLWDTLSEDVLPWAEFVLPLGAKPQKGQRVPVEAGDLVWVDFPRMGDSRYPRIQGSIYTAPDGVSNLPDLSDFEAKRADGEPEAAPYDLIKDDIYSRFGLIEHKTHNGGWCITHEATGSAIEIGEDGHITIHSESDLFQSGKMITFKFSDKARIEASEIALVSDGEFSVEAGGELKFKGAKTSWMLG